MSVEINRKNPDGTEQVSPLGEGQCAVVEGLGEKALEIHIFNLSGDRIEMRKPGAREVPETVEILACELNSQRALSFLEGSGINLIYKDPLSK
jgi:hypothetical protein